MIQRILRRLYFILPGESQAMQVVRDLEGAGLDRRHIHAVPGKGTSLTQLPLATERQRCDTAGFLERVLWKANLAVFCAALLGFLVVLYIGSLGWVVATVATMAVSLLGGALFAISVPGTHLDEFRAVLSHDNVLLMVDVPKTRAAEIETLVEHRHPEAVAGGASWTIEAFGI
jgi:hypothetical protein